MSNICLLEKTSFQNHYSKSSGGVISAVKVILNIKCCFFVNNTSPNHGGCIYCENSPFTLRKSTFLRCCSTANTNNIWGNAIYCYQSSSYCDNFNVVLCSYSSSQASDSSICFHKSLVNVENLNSSYNYGVGGGSSFTFQNAYDNSQVSYSLNIGGSDHSMAEAVYCSITLSNSDFINCTNCEESILFTELDGGFWNLFNCIFWNTQNKKFINSNFYEAINCKIDQKIDKMTQITEELSNNLTIEYKCRLFQCESQQKAYHYDIILKASLFVNIISQINT